MWGGLGYRVEEFKGSEVSGFRKQAPKPMPGTLCPEIRSEDLLRRETISSSGP